MRFKIDRASLIVGSKFKVFALFYFVFEGNFPSTRPWGAYICRGDLMEGFLRYRFGRLIFGGAYFRNFMVLYVTGIPLWDTASMNFLFYSILLQVKSKEEKKLHRLNWKKKKFHGINKIDSM